MILPELSYYLNDVLLLVHCMMNFGCAYVFTNFAFLADASVSPNDVANLCLPKLLSNIRLFLVCAVLGNAKE